MITRLFVFTIFIFINSVVALFISWHDLRTKKLPIRLLQCATIFAFFIGYGALSQSFLSLFFGMGIGYLALFLPSYFSRGRLMGLGDAWVGAWMGAVLGFPQILLGLYFAVILGGAAALILLALGWKRKDQVPFAPFLCLGTIIALIYGKAILTFFM
jgi:prepilin signal peptidase PulO-like enzyme (type II secretory pathway)